MEQGSIIDSNSHSSASSGDDKEELKQVAATLTNLFTLLTTLGLAVKTSDGGHDFVRKHYILTNALALGIVAFFLVLLLHAMLQQHISINFFITLLLLVLGTLVSVLALSLISWTTSFITLALWVFVILLVVMFKCKLILASVFQRSKELIGSYKLQHITLNNVQEWIQSYWQQSTLLPV